MDLGFARVAQSVATRVAQSVATRDREPKILANPQLVQQRGRRPLSPVDGEDAVSWEDVGAGLAHGAAVVDLGHDEARAAVVEVDPHAQRAAPLHDADVVQSRSLHGDLKLGLLQGIPHLVHAGHPFHRHDVVAGGDPPVPVRSQVVPPDRRLPGLVGLDDVHGGAPREFQDHAQVLGLGLPEERGGELLSARLPAQAPHGEL
eukprot:CAMPEP_0176309654 /NCGR_PEP_ID=MMETSP0121_2-20121125/65190_1 /TAXON_ID=160619 /ORGANISM="Kryptoperidinium foliaceum, Strain CCMP 1326" /LENGTH=202 /DNA_ID=CAMNT_0017651563 /DNA_START=1 /DNA_END=606 /DNA_ORIENTATION=-